MTELSDKAEKKGRPYFLGAFIACLALIRSSCVTLVLVSTNILCLWFRLT